MNNREQRLILLTFALTTIVWCLVWAYALGKISRSYEKKIFTLELKNNIK